MSTELTNEKDVSKKSTKIDTLIKPKIIKVKMGSNCLLFMASNDQSKIYPPSKILRKDEVHFLTEIDIENITAQRAKFEILE